MTRVNLALKKPVPSDKTIERLNLTKDYLDKVKNTKTSVMAILTDGRDTRMKFYTGLSVKPKHWSKSSRKVLSADSNSLEYNKRLEAFKNRLINIYDEAKEKGLIPTNEYIKEELKPKVVAISKNKEFWTVWDKYLEAKRGNFKPKSFEKFNHLKKHLETFEQIDKLPLQLSTINSHTLERFQNYFFDIAKLRTQTTSKYIDIFKTFLNWTVDQGYSTNTTYKAFKTQKQPETLKIILTSSDIDKIEKATLPHDYLKNVRELLILSTLTGLRYSDYSRISKEHIKVEGNGSKVLVIRQEKTRDYVKLPLTDRAIRIIDRLISGELRAITNQKLNSYVKEVCKVAGIDEKQEVFIDRGKLSISKKEPKYELVTTHTGRRTFATRLLLKGVPPEVVMRYTGHKDYQSFKKYVNIPKQTEFDLVKKALLG